MKTLIFGTILFVAVCPMVFGQTTANNCPEITVTGPMGVTNPGSSMQFAANVTGFSEPEKLAYSWSVSKGTITGQGTAEIQVSTTKAHQNSNTTATVKITGLPAGCIDTASETGSVAGIPEGDPYDEFDKLARNDVKARIANFFIRLNSSPDSRGIIRVRFDEKNARASKITYLNNMYNAIIWLREDPARVTFVIFDKQFGPNTTLWEVPPGAETEFLTKGGIIVKGKYFKQRIKSLFPNK